MYLKQVELQGFKSFATRSTFEFHKGITCIVGPNGSGKSNVADAVRWVLGEQSARQLRGHNMQDVIFAGTQNRKPVSFASVSLLLDNADHALAVDYDEVKVTRRIYRSGESEYLLNGAACRLRDIQELFYDTGVGKEGYSLIGQGQIEKILNGKPQERRELFDEAAGIVKFKRRKSAAQKKLEHEQENLVRVNDIITELEHRVGPLKAQSEKAKVYLQEKAALREVDLQLYALQAQSTQIQKEALSENLKILTDELEDARGRYEEGKAQSVQIEEAQRALEERIEALRTQQNESTLQQTALTHRLDLLAAQERAEEMTDAHYAKRLADLEDSLGVKAAGQEEYTEKYTQMQQALEEAAAQKEAVQRQLQEVSEEIRHLQTQTDDNQAQILALLEQKTKAEGRHQHYDTLLKETAQRKEQLEAEILAGETQQEALLQQAQEAAETLAAARTALLAVQQAQREAQQTLEAQTQERNTLRAEREETQRSLVQAQSRLESLLNMAERYDGYNQSIRMVMQKKHPGVLGVVADLIRVDKQYETAIETALGGSIQNIVTSDSDAAREMIEYLKREKLGRATFLPLTDVSGRGSHKEEAALGEDGVIGMADALVQTDEKYRGICSYLLGGILVVSDSEHALRIERKYHHSLRIVTPEGEYFRPGGSITGGAFRSKSNLLGRRREQASLESAVRKYTIRLEEAGSRMQEVTRLREESRENISALQAQILQKELEVNTAQSSCSRIADESCTQTEHLEALRSETEQIGQRLSRSDAQQEDVSGEMQRIAQAQRALEAENLANAALMQEACQKRDALAASAEEQLLAVQSLEQNLAFLQENISRIQEEISQLAAEASSIRRTQAEAREKKASAGDQEAQIRLSITEADQQAAQASEALQAALQEKEAMQISYREFFEMREGLTQDIARLEKEEFRLNGSLSQLEETMEKRDEYIWEEYGLTRREALALKKEDGASESALRRQSKEISGRIRALGNVNVNAIEEYKEVGERYELMTAQRSDMEEARENLEKMIASLDTGMRRQFREQFAKIQEEFQKVFKELFGGGTGTLELVQGEDDLETGIEIIAQPPGKKLQNMMQLSGGEKALTAICLLFAIQNLKPSPFCILDEIEAALDEPNVDRFAQYLKRLSGRTQFIVITHRRGSMAAADRLYGITMQEKGVSAQVSVQLAEEELV